MSSVRNGKKYFFPGESYLSTKHVDSNNTIKPGYREAEVKQCAVDFFRAGANFVIDGFSGLQLSRSLKRKGLASLSEEEKLKIILREYLTLNAPREIQEKLVTFLGKYLHQGAFLNALDGALTFKAASAEPGSVRSSQREIYLTSYTPQKPYITIEEKVKIDKIYSPNPTDPNESISTEPLFTAEEKGGALLEGLAIHHVFLDDKGDVQFRLEGITLTSFHEKATELFIKRDWAALELKNQYHQFLLSLTKQLKKTSPAEEMFQDLERKIHAVNKLLAILEDENLYIDTKLDNFANEFAQAKPTLTGPKNLFKFWGEPVGDKNIHQSENTLKSIHKNIPKR